ncbi:hypothetical protein, partial [Photobacterium sp. 53610]|uniref:hypothetical protein n=1 Tax=Photobacterium sp. 53610 TaxID=3102789 RepID=UPI002EDB9C83
YLATNQAVGGSNPPGRAIFLNPASCRVFLYSELFNPPSIRLTSGAGISGQKAVVLAGVKEFQRNQKENNT